MTKLKIGQKDGFGNIVGKLVLDNYGFGSGTVELKNIDAGDIIQIKNKEDCVIATYVVVKE